MVHFYLAQKEDGRYVKLLEMLLYSFFIVDYFLNVVIHSIPEMCLHRVQICNASSFRPNCTNILHGFSCNIIRDLYCTPKTKTYQSLNQNFINIQWDYISSLAATTANVRGFTSRELLTVLKHTQPQLSHLTRGEIAM